MTGLQAPPRPPPIPFPLLDLVPLAVPPGSGRIGEPPSTDTTRYIDPKPPGVMPAVNPDLGRTAGILLMGSGGKGGGGGGRKKPPAEPTFSLEEVIGLPPEDQIAKALAYHHEKAIRALAQSRGSLRTRRQREEALGRCHHHRQVASLLETDSFSQAGKLLLVRSLHHPDAAVRSHVERVLSVMTGDRDRIPVLEGYLTRLDTYGLAEEIPLPTVASLTPDDQAQADAFFRNLTAGTTAVAVVNFARLPPDGRGSISILTLEDESDVSWDSITAAIRQVGAPYLLAAFAYTTVLGREINQMNGVRRHLYELGRYVTLLGRALTNLGFPVIVRLTDQELITHLGPETANLVRQTLPHGSLRINEELFQQVHLYGRSLLDGARPMHTRFHFPVVVAVPQSEVRDGRVDLATAPRMEIYVAAANLPIVRDWAHGAGLEERITFHPFLPPPEMPLMGIAGITPAGVAVTFATGKLEHLVIDNLLARVEGGEVASDEEFPEEMVAATRTIHSHPKASVRYGRTNLLAGIATVRRSLPPDHGPHQALETSEGIAEILDDRRIPIEVRAALRDLFSTVEQHVMPFLRDLVPNYRQAATRPDFEAQKIPLCRALLTEYFRHFPWAEEIMIEEGMRRETPLSGYRSRPPLDIAEIAPEDRPNAHRFAYVATRLALILEDRVRRFMQTVANMPTGASPTIAHHRWERLAALSFYDNRPAFDFIETYEGRGYYDTRLGVFLASLQPREAQSNRGRRRFQTSIESHTNIHHAEVRRAIDTLSEVIEPVAAGEPTSRWELTEEAALLAYRLSTILPAESASSAIRHIAASIRGWRQVRGEEDDPLINDLIELVQPQHLVATLNAFQTTLEEEGPLRERLVDFIRRQAGNLNAIQYLLVALHVQRRHRQPREWLEQVFQRERQLSSQYNPAGKIQNDPFFKHALFEVFSFHFKASLFPIAEEGRVILEFARSDDVAAVEVIPETWERPVPDLRVHPRGGRPFLVEIKTVRYTGEGGFEEFKRRVLEQVQKATGQLSVQHRETGERGNRVITTIQRPIGNPPLEGDQLHLLQDEAAAVVAKASHISSVEIRQREF